MVESRIKETVRFQGGNDHCETVGRYFFDADQMRKIMKRGKRELRCLNFSYFKNKSQSLLLMLGFRSEAKEFRFPCNAGITARALPVLIKKGKRAVESAELTGEAVIFDQGRGQGNTVSLTAFFTKENHRERALLTF